MSKIIHQGQNVKRFREMMGIKQEALAADLGDDWSQKKISLLEQKEVIDPKLLQEIADIFRVPADAIKNFDEEKAIINIQHNYEGSYGNASHVANSQFTFNPLEKLIEVIEKNEKLYEELLKMEREKNALLERMLKMAEK